MSTGQLTVMWMLVGFYATTALGTVAFVGQPRRPITPGGACAVVVINSLLIAGILYVAGRL